MVDKTPISLVKSTSKMIWTLSEFKLYCDRYKKYQCSSEIDLIDYTSPAKSCGFIPESEGGKSNVADVGAGAGYSGVDGLSDQTVLLYLAEWLFTSTFKSIVMIKNESNHY